MRLRLYLLLTSISVAFAHAADQPQWGEAWSRNMVSAERNLPDFFDLTTGRNIEWVAKLGSEGHSTPIVSQGRVFIGTNNEEPRDPKHQGDRGVLMCFDEKDGHFLWQCVVPKREEDPFFDWPKTGWSSSPSVEGNRLYVVDNRGEVLCLDLDGMANGNDGPFLDEGAHMTAPPSVPPKPVIGASIQPRLTWPSTDVATKLEPGPLDADIIWIFDMVKDAGIWPHDGAHSSILIHGDFLYLNTGTGVDNTHRAIRTPDAPSLIVLEKKTGRLVARDQEHIAPNIVHAAWAAPSLGKVNGRELVFFGGGDGIVRAFEPLTEMPPAGKVRALHKVWQFDPDPGAPKENIHRYMGNKLEGPSNILAMPVFSDNRLYVAGGGDLWWGKNQAWLQCVDPAAGSGDITPKAGLWRAALDRHVMSTPAIHDGLLFIADCGKKLHCFDAATGEAYWAQDLEGEVWASPLVADGKVYLGTRHGDFWIMSASKEKRVLQTVRFGKPISGTATAANGALYVATMTHLYKLRQGAQLPPPKTSP
ncbi:MAG TPA: PQQ-binding-like beta-propeller repeat protein [Chthoniobacteraceae bacterium]|jgi:outer membrane protein assembly factor BamB